MFVTYSMYSVTAGQDFIQESVGQGSLLLAQDMAKFIEFGVSIKIDDLIDYSKTEIVQNLILKSNQEFGEFKNIQGYITQQDDDWQSVPAETITPFMQSLISNELSEDIRKNFVEKINPKTGHSVIAEIILTNEYGANVAQSGKTTDYRQDDENWWQEAKVNGISISKTEYDESSKTDVIPIGIKITDENGKFIGAMKAALSARSIIREAELFTQYDVTTQVNIVTEEGRLVYSTMPFRFNENVSDLSFFKKIQSGQQQGFFVDSGEFRKELVAYVQPSNLPVMGEQGWIFVIKHDIGDFGIMSGMLTLRNNMIIYSAIIVVIALGMGLVFSRSISNPITKLTYLAKEIGKENFDVKVNLKGRGEIAQLIKNMKNMGIALKKAKKQKEDFSAMITHELKTPLASIIGYSDMLNKLTMGELNEEQQFAIGEIYLSSMDLSSLIEKILTAQKLELHQQSFNLEKISIKELLNQVNNRLLPLMLEKQIEFLTSADEDFIITTDKEKMMEVFSNLLHNSIDFTTASGGRIEIKSSVKNSDILFSVTDNGIGIPKDKLKNLFTKFYQVDSSITRKHGGSGLGLAICKGIIEGLGGKIWIESEEGKGTNIYFTIPKESRLK